MKDLYIIGAGGLGREVAWLIERINEVEPTWNVRGFIDDNSDLWGRQEGRFNVLGGCEYLASLGEVYAVCAIGSAHIRKNIVNKLKKSKVSFATLIDPSVIFSKSIQIGEGTIICAGNIFTVDINIGNYVIVDLACTIGHDAIIGDFVTLYPNVNLSGKTVVKNCTELGTGSKVIQGKSIASDSVIGAGTVIINNITESGTYVGVPARRVN